MEKPLKTLPIHPLGQNLFQERRMIQIGKYHILRVLRLTRPGAYLGDQAGNEVLLPSSSLPEGLQVNGSIRVFIYRDGEERLIATTRDPLIALHQFAYLRVNDVSAHGAFLDWGLEKELFVPFREQPHGMEKGHFYWVYLYRDETTDRLVASARVKRFLQNETLTVQEGDEVDVLAWEPSPLGMKVIINHQHAGLVYQSELFGPFPPGEHRKGYVSRVRPGNKIDIQLRKPGYASIEDEAARLMEALQAHRGFLPLSDHSSPEDIQRQLSMSKKSFKKAVGLLYKQQLIRLDPEGIYLTETKIK